MADQLPAFIRTEPCAAPRRRVPQIVPSAPILLSAASLACGRFRLDPAARVLLDEAGQRIDLRPKTFDLLHVLLQRADRLVTREELLDLVWGEIHVTDDSVTQCVVEIRRALAERAGVRIRTIPRRGYLLEAGPAPAAEADATVTVLPFLDGEAGRPGPIGTALSELLMLELAQSGTVQVVVPTPLPRGTRPRRHRSAPHLLRGTVWNAGGRLRVVAQLVEGATGRLVWAERYDGQAVAAPLDAGEEIAGRIARGAGEAFAALGRQPQVASQLPAAPAERLLRLADRR
jgi:DNA-binding winged helix-turn-helix (wHTH) protein